MFLRCLFLLVGLALPQVAAAAECVVLLHGLSRTGQSMKTMEVALRKASYKVVNAKYPSTRKPIEQLTPYVSAAVQKCGDVKVNFVTHSLGGIVLRAWLRDSRPANLGNVVMLAPPNQGSEIADDFSGSDLMGMMGPAAKELGTGPDSLPRRLGPANYTLGIIAGDRSANPIFSSKLSGPNDGMLTVASTRLQGMRDHITLNVTHTFIMNNPMTIAQTLTFLQKGRFDRGLDYNEATLMVKRIGKSEQRAQ
ncbi:MAG: alpha/beta hydrolase [Mesorhizobium sp.]|nr:alpha/beta hydrolase [Mesorhizobium sp.]